MLKNIHIHRHYPLNGVGTDYVVGDIHGCWSQLKDELDRVGFDASRDRLFSVGDLIDRGPESLRCLHLIREGWFHSVLGNHEKFLLDNYSDGPTGDLRLWYMNGGEWEAYEDPSKIKSLEEEILYGVPLAITVETSYGPVGICHAEPPTKDWNDVVSGNLTPAEIEACLWSRRRISRGREGDTSNVTLTIHGHTVVEDPKLIGNSLFIDTGSFLKELDIDNYPGVKIHKIDDLLGEYCGN